MHAALSFPCSPKHQPLIVCLIFLLCIDSLCSLTWVSTTSVPTLLFAVSCFSPIAKLSGHTCRSAICLLSLTDSQRPLPAVTYQDLSQESFSIWQATPLCHLSRLLVWAVIFLTTDSQSSISFRGGPVHSPCQHLFVVEEHKNKGRNMETREDWIFFFLVSSHLKWNQRGIGNCFNVIKHYN